VTAPHPKLVLLRRRAREENRPVAEILQYYAMERFLFRLGVSAHAEAFVLKGAMMLRVWDAPTARSTRDIDFLAYGPNDLGDVVSRLLEICEVSVPDDGLRFDVDSFRAEQIKEGDDYQGARVRFVGRLGETQIQMQVDLGFGDVVHPEIDPSPMPRTEVLADSLNGQTHIGNAALAAPRCNAVAAGSCEGFSPMPTKRIGRRVAPAHGSGCAVSHASD